MWPMSVKHTIAGDAGDPGGTTYELVHGFGLSGATLLAGLPVVTIHTLPDWDGKTDLVVRGKSRNSIILVSSRPFEGPQFEVEVIRP
jgi:hypothetical protein